jgi:hypothetical protein
MSCFWKIASQGSKRVVVDESIFASDVMAKSEMDTLLKGGPVSPTKDPFSYGGAGHRPTVLPYHDLKLLLLLREGSGYASFIQQEEETSILEPEAMLRPHTQR